MRSRLDRFLVEQGFTESREKAQALIMAGEVLVNGQKALKPGQPVNDGIKIELTAKLKYVSRGGLKMEGAISAFHISVAGLVCADFGSSTGGFTDCLLQNGAVRVHAIDVGTGQLDWRLRKDPRVIVREGVNARYIDIADIGEKIDLATCDVSFISATLIIPAMARILKPDGRVVVLVKPQFEVGKGQVGKGGIVRDSALHEESCEKVRGTLNGLGFQTRLADSPITGTEGNKEFLLYGYRLDA